MTKDFLVHGTLLAWVGPLESSIYENTSIKTLSAVRMNVGKLRIGRWGCGVAHGFDPLNRSQVE